MPRKKYIHIVASREQLLDLKTTNFEDIISQLKTYEERIHEEEGENEDNNQSKLMYANWKHSQTVITMASTEDEDE